MTTLASSPRENRADPMTWTTGAACIGRPDLTDQRGARKAREALELCAHCPVMDACRAWADSEDNYVGVAGGRVYSERRNAA